MILRKQGIYSLCKSDYSESKTLKYYVDDGEDCSEYFDSFERDRLLALNDENFFNECSYYF